MEDILTFFIISCIWLHPRGWNSLWNNNTHCLSYTDNTMAADALGTLGSQGISRHGIDPSKPKYSISSIRRVNHMHHFNRGSWNEHKKQSQQTVCIFHGIYCTVYKVNKQYIHVTYKANKYDSYTENSAPAQCSMGSQLWPLTLTF